MNEYEIVYHLVGEQTVPVFLPAIQFSQQCMHYLLVTEKTQKIAKNIQQELIREGYHAEVRVLGAKEIAFQFRELNDKLSEIFQKTNPNNRRSAFNITGGTKPMAFIALHQIQLYRCMRAFYLDTEGLKKIIWLDNFEETTPQKVLTIDNFIGLSGLKKRTAKQEESSRFEALSKLAFKHSLSLQREQAAFCVNRPEGGTISKSDFEKTYARFISLLKSDAKNAWKKEYDLAFAGSSWVKQAAYMSGGWFENYIFSILKDNSKIKEIQQNLTLHWPDRPENQLAQEFDIVYTDGWSLIILECKAGTIYQEHLQKLENLRDNFSGSMGKAALISVNDTNTKNNQKIIPRIKNSRKISAFCGKSGIAKLPHELFQFLPGKIYQ